MTESLLKRIVRRAVTLQIATIGTSTMVLMGTLQSTPVQAASHVSRVSLAQAANGYTVKATYNMDVVIRFDGNEHIAYVWGSNNLLFNPRFVTGGKLLVLQSTARPTNMAVFIQFLQQGRTDGAEFEPKLAMAQRMTGMKFMS